MDKAELQRRTKTFALRTMKLVRALPKDVVARAIASQLIRCATSVGANYRASCRGRSRAEFIAKLGIVVEECDETSYWLELIIEDAMLPRTKVEPLLREADEIAAIIYSAIRTTRSNAKC